MIELESKILQRVAPLFRGIPHNVPLVYGVIEGNSPRRVFVDREDDPTSTLLHIPPYQVKSIPYSRVRWLLVVMIRNLPVAGYAFSKTGNQGIV